MRPSQGFGDTGEQGYLFQGNKGQILRGTGEQRCYRGTGNIKNKFSIFGEQGNKPIYFMGTREQVPPPWEGLISIASKREILFLCYRLLVLYLFGFCWERFRLRLGDWVGLRYFIVALPEPSIYFLPCKQDILCHCFLQF